MNRSFSRAPHIEGVTAAVHPATAPNAALLIDFDNVTMGMRSDLSRELKVLLNSDVIRGKVTVQRAYADWRRYPQYIVPLSEASIDLIFAPAYGSNKKNATDIRMAIDGMELVFTRPEIGTFILLTGDSDFSSLVLKLKEYGKYVIGVGIQESSSDILVQNCDEYYSYTSLSGLRKTDEPGVAGAGTDPWVLVERAVEQMVKRSDVMRSDRLKQVMLEIDPGFDEKGLGFSKFSRFLSEASTRGLVRLQKMENGQYEIGPPSGGGAPRSEEKREERPRRSDRGRGGRARPDAEGGSRESSPRRSEPVAPPAEGSESAGTPARSRNELEPAYDLLRRAVSALLVDQGADSVRDSDVKRRMLVLEPGFDESEMGFPKFSRFLRQAHDHEVVTLSKGEDGNYQVMIGRPPQAGVEVVEGAPAPREAESREVAPSSVQSSVPTRSETIRRDPAPVSTAAATPPAPTPGSTEDASTDRGSFWSRLLRPRDAATRRRDGDDGPPPLFEGQAIPSRGGSGAASRIDAAPSAAASVPPTAAPVPSATVSVPHTGASVPSAAASVPSAAVSPSAAASVPSGASGQPVGHDVGVARSVSIVRKPSGPVLDPASLHLPTGRESMILYLTNSYAGVGERTAEALVSILGEELFVVLQKDPARIEALLPHARAEKVLEGWAADFERRKARHGGVPLAEADTASDDTAADDQAAFGLVSRRTRGEGDRF